MLWPMPAREFVVLGTASQAPTRHRNHNGYLLRWDAEGLLFDPGEGTQRQMLLAGVASSAITRICVTHFHGDHCLGLPGVLQRLSLDRVAHAVDVWYPAAGQVFYDRLRHCALYNDTVEVRPHPALGDAAFALADAADLVVCESTFLERDADLAAAYGHLTAAQAARVAKGAGARQLVLTHFSQRYPDDALFAAEAGEIFPDVVVARD